MIKSLTRRGTVSRSHLMLGKLAVCKECHKLLTPENGGYFEITPFGDTTYIHASCEGKKLANDLLDKVKRELERRE